MGVQEKQKENTLTIKGTFISLLQVLIAGAIGIGAFIAYSESKFTQLEQKYVQKELYNSEVTGIKDMLRNQSSKLDRIYDLIIDKK